MLASNNPVILVLHGAYVNQYSATQSLAVRQLLLTQLKSAKAVGRLVIDLNKVMAINVGSEQGVILRDVDSLAVPRYRQAMTVVGEVQTTISHLYQKGLARGGYMAQSGGMTRKAGANRSMSYAPMVAWWRMAAPQCGQATHSYGALDTERLPTTLSLGKPSRRSSTAFPLQRLQ